MNNKYMVIAEVKGTLHMTSVIASNSISAEHTILNMSICGKHTYGVTTCQAFNSEEMKYDHFICMAMESKLVSFDELKAIIEARNAEIKERDEAEETISKNQKLIDKLNKEIEEAQKILEKE